MEGVSKETARAQGAHSWESRFEGNEQFPSESVSGCAGLQGDKGQWAAGDPEPLPDPVLPCLPQHLCGHVHTTRENDFLEKWRQELRDTRKNDGDSCGNIYNVGCMLPYMGYTPQTLDEILAFHGELGTEDAANVETPNN